jgi:hypothetical protein
MLRKGLYWNVIKGDTSYMACIRMLLGAMTKNVTRKDMTLTFIRHLLSGDNLNKIIGRVTFLIRIALKICISLFVIILAITPITSGDADNNIEAFFFFSAFYSIIWGTIPSIFLLIAIALDNRYRKKPGLQPLKTEVKLLAINIIIILVTVTINWFISVNQ